MGTTLMVACIIGSIIALAMAIISFIAIIRTWQILKEIIASGAFPSVIAVRVKKDAKEALMVECVGYSSERLERITHALSNLKNDAEAIQLLHQIDEFKAQ